MDTPKFKVGEFVIVAGYDDFGNFWNSEVGEVVSISLELPVVRVFSKEDNSEGGVHLKQCEPAPQSKLPEKFEKGTGWAPTTLQVADKLERVIDYLKSKEEQG